MGNIWVHNGAIDMQLSNNISLAAISQNLQQYIYGSITLATVAAITFGFITFIVLKIFKKKHAPAL
jgi:hypothetical protein